MKEYLKLAIPSMLFVVIEWAAYDVLIIFTGLIDIQTQAAHIILYHVISQHQVTHNFSPFQDQP